VQITFPVQILENVAPGDPHRHGATTLLRLIREAPPDPLPPIRVLGVDD
jgi:hypothetical protein